jgi:hypothetical protein
MAGIAVEFLTVDARLKCEEGRIVPNLKMDHSFNVEVPVVRWVANIPTIPSAFECLDVLAHAKSLLGELNVIDYNTRVGAISIGNCAKRVHYTAGALTAFIKFGHARVGHY